MIKSIVNYKEYFTLFLCILISLILLFSNSSRQIEAIKAETFDFMGTIQGKVNSIARKKSLEDKYNFLKNQNTLLALQNSQMRNAFLENQRLRKLIGFKESHPFNLKVAKVVGGSLSKFLNHIVLDVGLEDSVKKNMPLVLPEGLVGKIYHVGRNHSIGHLLLDQNFRVSAKIFRSGIKGIISWNGGKNCSLEEIPNRSDVQIGDSIMTSGFSDIFPEGIYIGKVVSAENTTRHLFMKINVKPEVNFLKLEEVLLILNKKTEKN